ncbi:MAG: hypothetical protein Q7S68_02935 [Deltaproteobacteria bacterium]|nr:hypothetical protein [Deltaproteobacteria bacterium]
MKFSLYFAAFLSLVLLFCLAIFFCLYGLAGIAGEIAGNGKLGYLLTGGTVSLVLAAIWYWLTRKYSQQRPYLQKELEESLDDLSGMVQKHPWGAVTIAALGGFITSSQIYLTKDQLRLFAESLIAGSAMVPQLKKKRQK